MYVKIHQTSEGRIVAACDKELIGRVLDDGSVFIDLGAHKSFYVGRHSDSAMLSEALASFHSASLIGEKAVVVARKLGLVKNDEVKHINRIPYIHIYKI